MLAYILVFKSLRTMTELCVLFADEVARGQVPECCARHLTGAMLPSAVSIYGRPPLSLEIAAMSVTPNAR